MCRQLARGQLGHQTLLQRGLVDAGEAKPVCPQPTEHGLFGLARRGDQDRIHTQGRQVELRAVATPAKDHLCLLQGTCEGVVFRVVPHRDVCPSWVGGMPGFPATSKQGSSVSAIQALIASSIKLRWGSTPLTMPSLDQVLVRLGLFVLGQTTQDADVLDVGVDVGMGQERRSGTLRLAPRRAPRFHRRPAPIAGP